VSDKETALWMREAAAEIWRRFAATFPEVEPASEIGFDKPIAQIIAKHAEECTAQAPTELEALIAKYRKELANYSRNRAGEYEPPEAFVLADVIEDLEKVMRATPQGTPTCNAYIGGPPDAKCVLPAKHTGNCHAISPENAAQGTPTPAQLGKCPLCGSGDAATFLGKCAEYHARREPAHIFHWESTSEAHRAKMRGVPENAPTSECPQCGSKDFWTVLPACHGGKAHKWHRKGNL
jgi:hypothetical protein